MRKKLALLLVSLGLAIATGCANITEITDLDMYQVRLEEKEDGEFSLHSTLPVTPDENLDDLPAFWFGSQQKGEAYAVVVQFDLPEGLEAGSIKGAILEIPISTMTLVPPRTIAQLEEVHKAEYGAYRIVDPDWRLVDGPFHEVALPQPEGTVTFEGSWLQFSQWTEYIRVPITEMVKAWAAGEPNLGIVLMSEDEGGLPNGALWSFRPPRPEDVARPATTRPATNADRTDDRPAKVTIWYS